MALGRRSGTVLNQANGRPVPNASVQVRVYESVLAATIYEDEDGIVTADNPLLTDERGHYEYFAANGQYTEIITTNTDQVTNAGIAIEAPPLRATLVYDPASLADGAGVSQNVTVPGAALGDEATAAFSVSTQGILLDAQVTATNTVTVRFQNETTGVIDLAAGTIYVTVRKRVG
jgi:hypothetical protein